MRDPRGGHVDTLWAHNKPPFPAPAIWDFAFWSVIGIVLGGRTGYVLFYNLPQYLAHPAEIFALWDGGMSFHGGLIGIMLAMALFTRSKGGSILQSFDLLGAIGTIGIFLVRIANFINGELYGAPADLPWAVVFPTDPDQLPRAMTAPSYRRTVQSTCSSAEANELSGRYG